MELFIFVPMFIAFVWIFIIAVLLTTTRKTRRINAARAKRNRYEDYRGQQYEEGYLVRPPAEEPKPTGFFPHNDPQHSTEGVGNAPLHVVQPSFESGHYHAETSITGIQHDEPPKESVVHKKVQQQKPPVKKAQAAQKPEEKKSPPHHSRYRDAVVYGELLRPKYF